MKQTQRKVLPPERDELVAMTADDFQLVQEKVKIFRLGPVLMRVGIGLVYLIMAAFVFGTDQGMGLFIGFSVLFVLAWLLGEWGLKHFLGMLREDLEAKQKRVVEGVLHERIQRASAAGRTGKQGSHYWKIGEEKYRVDANYYDLAKEDDRVRIEMLPKTSMVFHLQVLSVHED